MRLWVLPPAAYVKVKKEIEVDKTDITCLHVWKMIVQIHIVIVFLFLSLDRALRRHVHTKVCNGLDIAHFLSLMYGFIMQQEH